MHASFVDRYADQGRSFCLYKQRADQMSPEELLAIIGFLSRWAPDKSELTLADAHDLPPPNDGLLEG
jgi:hypothetical protein